jgi:glycosyltransferase involved in cell wall biosynthesis
MPLHDKREFVVRAVNAVLGQTWRDLELVVVDDGSTDGGADLLATIADPRLRVMRTERRGPGAARNTGARNSRAPWIAFVDADDEWHPTFLEKALAAARSAAETVLVFCDVYARGQAPRRLKIGSGTLNDYFEARMRYRVAVSSSSNLIRAEHFAAIGGFPEDFRYAEDIETWLRLSCRGPFYFIAEPLCVIEAGAARTIARGAHPLERVAGLQRLFDSFAALERSGAMRPEHVPACRRFMQHQRGRQALHLAAAGRRLQALQLLSRVPFNSHTWRDWARCVARVLLRRTAR